MSMPLGMQWFRDSNKYIENLYLVSTSNYGTSTVLKDNKDDAFVAEFEFIIEHI